MRAANDGSFLEKDLLDLKEVKGTFLARSPSQLFSFFPS